MKIGRRIVLMEFGSHIYGTNVPTSDHDYKGIFVPEVKDILLQRASKTSITESTKTDPHAKNTASDIDTEWFTLQAFIRLCHEGQTVAMDMLFAPDKFWKESSVEWNFIQFFRDQLIHRGTSAFVGYVRQQAAKYGIKGSRVAAMRQVLNALGTLPDHLKLNDFYLAELQETIGKNEHIGWVNCKGPNRTEELHLEVCNRKVPLHARVKYAIQVYGRIFDEYGHRALAAEQNQNIDWKALMHAVRVSKQAEELLTTGHVTFPRPECELLLKIRKGELPYRQVAALIEEGVEQIEQIQKTSKLPDAIDLQFWNDWVANAYSLHIQSLQHINPALSNDR